MHVATRKFNQQKMITCIVVFALFIGTIFTFVPKEAFAADPEPVASFTGTNIVSERDVNKDGLTIRIAPPDGYAFDSVNLAVYKNDIINGLTFYGMKFDKTLSGSNYYTQVPLDTYITSVLNLYGTTSGDETYFPYLDYANQVTVYDRFVGLNPPGAKSHVTNPSDALKAQYPGVKQSIINALKAGATVSVDANGNLVIYCSKDAADGYFANFASDLPVVDGGIPAAASGDIALSATLPAGVVLNYSQPVSVNNFFLIQEIKAHIEVWQYVDASQANEPGVYTFDRKVDNTGTTYYKNTTGIVTANGTASTLTYYVKRVPGDVLTEYDIRNGGTLGPNGTGNKLIKMVVDVRSGPTQWAEGKPKLSILYNMFRTSKISTGYGWNDDNTYTPADHPEWFKVEDKIIKAATAKTVGSDKYAVNYSGDSRRDTIDPKNMWMFWELPQTPDFDISSDMSIYLNEIGGFFGGSGQMIGGDTYTGLPFSGMDGRYSFTIQTVNPAIPTANPAAGAVIPGSEVTLSTETVGASVYYAVYSAGIDPATVTFGLYTGPITINSDTTIKTYASANGEESGVFTAEYTVQVEPVTGVTLDRDEITLTVGSTGTLAATVAPIDATNKNVTWTTSDETVATVANGVVTAIKAGTATITVTTKDGSFTASSTVTVNPAAVAVTGVTLDQHELTLTTGSTGTLTATVAPANATNKNVTWTTSNPTVATVTYGVVNAVAAGTATITVTTEDGSFMATSKVTVSAAVTGGNDEDSDSNPGSSTPAGGGGAPATTTQTTSTDLGQVVQSGDTVTLQVDAQKAAKVLQDAAQTELVINLSQVAAESGQAKAVKLPAEAVNLAKAGNKSILIEDSGLKIVIPHEALTQGQDLTFSTAQVSSQPTAPAPEHVELKTVYSFDALAGETAVHNFTQSITITLPIPAGVTEPEKLGIYYLNETSGQWEYVGGRIVDGKLVFTTSHFSTYMLGEYQKTFSDLASHWAKTDIEVMAARHVVDGTDADSFAPQTNITRAEFAALLARVLKLSNASGNESFKDVTGSEWYANDVKKAANAGIIQGADGSFRPVDPITRQEMAVMISRAYSYAGGKPDTLKALAFTDNDSISTWASDAVQSAYTLGMINGYPDGSFGALANATRAEGTVMLKTFMDKLGL